jgi:hypothetical protein
MTVSKFTSPIPCIPVQHLPVITADSSRVDQLTGAFAVWAASKEAAFLHGRIVWVSWDIEELATGELRKRLDDDFYFLRGTIAGLNGGNLA